MADPSCGSLTDKLHSGHPGNETSRGEGQTIAMDRQQDWEEQASCEETFDVKVEKTDSSSHIEQVQSHMPERPFHSAIYFAHNGEKMADPGCGSSIEELYHGHPRIETSSMEGQTTDIGRQQDMEEQPSCQKTFQVKVEKIDSWSHVDPGCVSSMEELYQEHPENGTSSREGQTTDMGRQPDWEEQASCEETFHVKVEKTDSSSYVDPGCVSSMEELYQEHPENRTSSSEAQTTDIQQDREEQASCEETFYWEVEKTDSSSHINPGCGRSMEELYQQHPGIETSSMEGQAIVMDRQLDWEEQASCEETFDGNLRNTDSTSSSRVEQVESHMPELSTEKPHIDGECGAGTPDREALGLQLHMRTHTGDKPYKCHHCDYSSMLKSHLDIHLTNHTGEKPYMCSCGFGTHYSQVFRKHMRTHREEKPYKCDQCDYSAAKKSSLDMHLTNCTGEKHYRQGLGTHYRQGLQKHMGTHTSTAAGKSNKSNQIKSTHTGRKPYKCDQCNYSAAKKSSLDRHLAIHTGDKPYMCGECGHRTCHLSALKQHMRTHTGEKPYKCDQCDYSAVTKSGLDYHLLAKHTGKKPYKCRECGYRAVLKTALSQHMKTHTVRVNAYKCDHCDYSATRKASLDLHLLIAKHTSVKPYTCGECGYRAAGKNDLSLHLKRHRGENFNTCDQSDYSAAQRSQSDIHLANHTSETPFTCSDCGYRAHHKTTLIKHMKTHLSTGEKPYACEVCGYRAVLKYNLSRHMKTHVKPYKCDQCDYSAAQKSHLDKHLVKHTGEISYMCSECGYRTHRKSVLSNHMRTHRDKKPFKCEECGYRTTKKDALSKHMRTHTGDKPYMCDQCDYSATTTSGLVRHPAKHTGEKPYMCDHYDYSAAQKSDSVTHLVKNTDEKMESQMPKLNTEKFYMCGTCGFRTNKMSHLSRHLKTHTADKAFKCEHCDYSATLRCYLEDHIREHTDEKPYKCEKCGYRANRKSDLRAHFRTHTAEKTEQL